jgi:hypothetical protein
LPSGGLPTLLRILPNVPQLIDSSIEHSMMEMSLSHDSTKLQIPPNWKLKSIPMLTTNNYQESIKEDNQNPIKIKSEKGINSISFS